MTQIRCRFNSMDWKRKGGSTSPDGSRKRRRTFLPLPGERAGVRAVVKQIDLLRFPAPNAYWPTFSVKSLDSLLDQRRGRFITSAHRSSALANSSAGGPTDA